MTLGRCADELRQQSTPAMERKRHRPRRARRRRAPSPPHRADRRERHDVPARSAARDGAARRRWPGARRWRASCASPASRSRWSRSRRRTRAISRGSPGTSAIAIPTCRSSATGCASAAIMCWKTCCAVSARRSRSSRRRSIRSRAPMFMTHGQRPCLTARRRSKSAALYRLMAWLSPAYPVGAFSYSSGIEWAVEAGDIRDAETLRRWLAVVIGEGGGFCDAVFFVHAHRAVTADDDAALRAVAELAAAFAPIEGALSGDDGAGPRLPRRDARGLAVRGARRGSTPHGTAPSPIRSRSASRAPATASRASRRCMPFCTRSRQTGFPPACGSSRSARPTASACWPRSSRSWRNRRARADTRARRCRQRGVPRRYRQHASRDAVHAAVQVS